jgi:16S rRNA G966 N2-methylase RsmD
VVVSGFKSRILAVFICDTMRPSTGSMKNALPGW